MAPRRRTRRPWYRTRAYRLARTAVLTVLLVVGGVWWAQDEEPAEAATAAPLAPAEAPAVSQQGRATGTGLHGGRPEPFGARREPPEGRADARTARPQRPRPAVDATRAKPPRPGAGAGAGAAKSSPPGAGTGRARPEPPRAGSAASRPKPRPPGARAGARTAQPRRPAPRPKFVRRPPAPSPQRSLPRSRATRLAIPYLKVDAPVMALRLDRERRLPAPPDDRPNLVGWYDGGPTPGEQGTAVAVGHLDTDTGPAVFAGLTELKPGRTVEIRRADGRTAVYTVDAIKKYEKKDFPDREVYGARGRPELRLITCGGTYDRRNGYSGNVVVFAHLTQVREPGRAARTR
ncbi:class F sortase [Streptomyces sp. NBC_01352]|uniref:class F sortase n=1 Tax=Streptomyces sp. NBC_01352 TaxID=2903834 RepID=UPI003FCDDADF